MARQREFDEMWEADESGCHIWKGYTSAKGYGRYGRKQAHVYAWERANGHPVPQGLELDHLCRNPSCVNPDHLEPVSHYENLLRSPLTLAGRNIRKTHCASTHPYDEKNTYRWRNKRFCRTCLRENGRAFRQRRSERRNAVRLAS